MPFQIILFPTHAVETENWKRSAFSALSMNQSMEGMLQAGSSSKLTVRSTGKARSWSVSSQRSWGEVPAFCNGQGYL